MENAISIDDFLKLESERRKNNQWFVFSGWIKNDIDCLVYVECKSYGKYNQILRINNDGINYCFDHSMGRKTIKELKNKYKSILNCIIHAIPDERKVK